MDAAIPERESLKYEILFQIFMAEPNSARDLEHILRDIEMFGKIGPNSTVYREMISVGRNVSSWLRELEDVELVQNIQVWDYTKNVWRAAPRVTQRGLDLLHQEGYLLCETEAGSFQDLHPHHASYFVKKIAQANPGPAQPDVSS